MADVLFKLPALDQLLCADEQHEGAVGRAEHTVDLVDADVAVLRCFSGGLGAFLILLAEPGKALWFILFLLVLQQVEGNLIYPKVVGKSVGLPGLLVLMAVTIGGEAFGILGMLFSVPVCAVLFSLYLEFMKKASTL